MLSHEQGPLSRSGDDELDDELESDTSDVVLVLLYEELLHSDELLTGLGLLEELRLETELSDDSLLEFVLEEILDDEYDCELTERLEELGELE